MRACDGRCVVGGSLLLLSMGDDDVLVLSSKFVEVKRLSDLSLSCLGLTAAVIWRDVGLDLELLVNALLLSSVPRASGSSSDVSLLVPFYIEL